MIWFLLPLILFSASAYSLDSVYKCKESHNRIVYSQAPCSGDAKKIKLYDNTADYSFEKNKIAQEKTKLKDAIEKKNSELQLNCEGSHSETGAPVYGKCNGGIFIGYFSRTGKPVYGKCDVKGRLTAYDPETGKLIFGKCK